MCVCVCVCVKKTEKQSNPKVMTLLFKRIGFSKPSSRL